MVTKGGYMRIIEMIWLLIVIVLFSMCGCSTTEIARQQKLARCKAFVSGKVLCVDVALEKYVDRFIVAYEANMGRDFPLNYELNVVVHNDMRRRYKAVCIHKKEDKTFVRHIFVRPSMLQGNRNTLYELIIHEMLHCNFSQYGHDNSNYFRSQKLGSKATSHDYEDLWESLR